MIPLLPILGLVSQFAPDIIGLFSKDKGESADKALSAATGVIEAITGKKGSEAVEAIEGSPELQLEFKKALMADKHIEEQMRYADRGDARQMYRETQHEMQDKIAANVMGYNLWFVAALVVADVLLASFLPEGMVGVAVSVGTVIGTVIGALLKERQDVVGFAFGSSMGSKAKDVK